MFFRIIALLTFFFLPLYFLSSGGLQPVDAFIVVLFISIVCKRKMSSFHDLKMVMVGFVAFLFWVACIGLFHQMSETNSYKHILNFIYFYYGFFVFLTFANFFTLFVTDKSQFKPFFLLFCLCLAAVAPFFLGSMNMQARNCLSFNNPNQLAYYALLLLSMAVFILFRLQVTWRRKVNLGLFFILVALCNVMALLAVSRSGLMAVALLDLYIVTFIFLNMRRDFIVIALFLLVVIVSLCGMWKSGGGGIPDTTHMKVDSPLDRFKEKELLDKRDFLSRVDVFDRFNGFDEVIIGTSGRLDRHGFEVHNAMLGIVFNYGVVGGLLFCLGLLYLAIKLKLTFIDFIIMFPILLYNLTHYGLRFRVFWIAMALFFVLVQQSKFSEKITSVSTRKL